MHKFTVLFRSVFLSARVLSTSALLKADSKSKFCLNSEIPIKEHHAHLILAM